MQANTYGVDVASYQPTDLSKYGASFAIVKLTQGTYYKNPNAPGQLISAKKLGIESAGYFYATFSANSSQARLETQFAVAAAKNWGLPAGSYLATDWESGNGNNTNGSITYNTQAIITSMDVVASAGYKPLLYSGASLLKLKIDTKQILAKYPNSLWVASYPLNNGVASSSPDFGYFPSMDGVAIWQFTDNWKGLNVDGNICLLTTSAKKEDDDLMNWHPEINFDELGRFMVTRPNGAQLYADEKLTQPISGKVMKVGTTYKIFKAKNGAVNAGGSQWFSQADGVTKINPLVVNSEAKGMICKITADNAYTQNELKPSAGIKHLPKGSTWKILGLKNGYYIIGNNTTGKYIDATKTKIILW
ncbi:GH25 family lysozyme [Lactobacillus hominis]|uniref:GH25 family lysozyme n=1 Tax=Lactobacillus hominis TaxID=1203033 RepID=UPI0023F4E68B|nr:GH25 family lysozyme [Lactobacillus hominis]